MVDVPRTRINTANVSNFGMKPEYILQLRPCEVDDYTTDDVPGEVRVLCSFFVPLVYVITLVNQSQVSMQ